jgi:hypothetical protein
MLATMLGSIARGGHSIQTFLSVIRKAQRPPLRPVTSALSPPPSHLVGSANTRERSTAQLDCTQAPWHELELDQIPIQIGVSGARSEFC